jgi:Ser/Thr protein kinase RdoA (MazF antagonist)
LTIDTTPRFTIADGERLGREFYGLGAVAAPLPSERDQNFALTTAAGEKFVLKFAKSDEDPAVLQLQAAVLKHAARHAPNLALPRLVAARSGEECVSVTDARGRPYLMRLMTWIDGEVFAHALPHTEALLASLGTAMADLDVALQDFSHPAMHRELHWDVRHADLALKHLPLLSSEQQPVVRQLMNAWRTIDWQDLRHSVIHGDANDYNVLVRDRRVAGFLDFGDIVHSATVCDLAIALTYAMLDKPDPLAAVVPVVAAYHRRLPLTAAEVDALYPLTTGRLCMSLCYAAYNARAKSGDAYQLISAGPASALLQKLSVIPGASAGAAMRRACGIS